MRRRRIGRSATKRGFEGLVLLVGACAFALACFLVLPLIQAITKPPEADLELIQLDTTNLPPPPPPPPEEEEPEEEEEQEEPPQLTEETAPLDLSQLELALNPTFGDGWLGGDFSVKLPTQAAEGEEVDALFSLSDLDQEPRAIDQPSPNLDMKLRKKLKEGPGSVQVLFVIDERGRVEKAIVQRSSDPLFERAALSAVLKWRFEPGRRNGKAVRVKKSVPITFSQT